jgi:PAS domain S-box-containing protein
MIIPPDGERRFRAIFDSSPDCIKLVSADGSLIDMNAAGLRMIEANSLDAVRGKNLFDLIDPAYHHVFRRGINAVFAGEITQMQFEVIGLRGRRLFMDQTAAPLRADEAPRQVIEMMAITRDVTEQRKAEADLLQARLAQDTARSAAALATRLGQELNAPLGNIIGYSEMLLEQALEHNRGHDADDLRKVLNAADELRSKLNQLLQTALAEVRQDHPIVVGGDLDDLIEIAVEAVRPLAQANGNRISVEIGPHCASLPVDHNKLAQCLHALLAHAAKQTRNGDITVKARQMLADGQPRLVLSVIDTGSGMSPDELSMLFAPSASQYPGSEAPLASGLAAARKLALFMGGDITAASAPGQGARVTIKLPLRAASEVGFASPAARNAS